MNPSPPTVSRLPTGRPGVFLRREIPRGRLHDPGQRRGENALPLLALPLRRTPPHPPVGHFVNRPLAASQAELLPEDYPLLEERIQVLEKEQVELINVPVPEFEDGDPANIVHDFQRVRRRPLTMRRALLDGMQPTSCFTGNRKNLPTVDFGGQSVDAALCVFVCFVSRRRG